MSRIHIFDVRFMSNVCPREIQVMKVTGELRDTYTSKGKAIQYQAWTGPEGSRRLRPPEFKTIGT
jgi:hypothetical protein